MKGFDDPVVCSIIHQTREIILIRAEDIRIPVPDFAEDMNSTSCGLEARPKARRDFVSGVDAEAVDGVSGDDLADPLIPHVCNDGVLGSQIRKGNGVGAHPAVFDRVDVIVVDFAGRVEVGLFVKGVELAVVDRRPRGEGCHVIGHDVDHEIHASFVQLVGQRFQIFLGAELGVDGIEILRPVAMVGVAIFARLDLVLDDGTDPDRSEAHLLNVIQLIDEPDPSATAVLIQIARCRRRPITPCKPVGHDLIDRLPPPFGWSETIRQDNAGEDGGQETNRGRHGESAENRRRGKIKTRTSHWNVLEGGRGAPPFQVENQMCMLQHTRCCYGEITGSK